MSKFYEYGIDTIFTDMVHGNSETFYCHCAKYYVLRLVHIILDELNYGVGIWTIQGFEHRNKQSKYIYENKTNDKGNFCEQVLKGLHKRFISS
jgi:hypothetical protein